MDGKNSNSDSLDLSVAQESRLKSLEQVIETGLAALTSVGDALADIRDGRMYRATHSTFEAYCKDRWQIGRSQAYRMIDHSLVIDAIGESAGDLSPHGDISEKAARDIKPHLAEVTEKIREKVAAGSDPVQTTYEVIEAKRAEIKAAPKEPEPKEAEPVDGEADPWKELEAADKQIRDQDMLIKSLSGSDLAKEVADWQMKFTQLEGRLGQAVTTKNEAEKQARYYGDILKKIRKALGVEKTQQIIARIEQLSAPKS